MLCLPLTEGEKREKKNLLVPDPFHTKYGQIASPEIWLEMRNLGPRPDLWHQDQHLPKTPDAVPCTLAVGCAALDPSEIPRGFLI